MIAPRLVHLATQRILNSRTRMDSREISWIGFLDKRTEEKLVFHIESNPLVPRRVLRARSFILYLEIPAKLVSQRLSYQGQSAYSFDNQPQPGTTWRIISVFLEE